MSKKKPELVANDLLIEQLLDTGFSVASVVQTHRNNEALAKVLDALNTGGLSQAEVHFMQPHAQQLRSDLMRMLIRTEIPSFEVVCEVGKPLLLRIGSRSFESIRDAQAFLGKVSRNEVTL